MTFILLYLGFGILVAMVGDLRFRSACEHQRVKAMEHAIYEHRREVRSAEIEAMIVHRMWRKQGWVE